MVASRKKSVSIVFTALRYWSIRFRINFANRLFIIPQKRSSLYSCALFRCIY
ncbi:hypothetical protein HMPREF9555_00804 [Selenomonas artemidis F0399]|uniref:Uncharacterized protein n=1 Tax=Selenomonas artemidis F0399 TaxID=749551 RepID=E7N1F0_9FIRM|nr:hypothetical protein HMPREF9555_00804 [Selenomonas artemidis F0399]